MTVLDEQAKDILRRLRPGSRFTLKGEGRMVLEVKKVEYPVEQEPWIRAHVVEGPKRNRTLGAYRSPAVSMVEQILPEE